MLASLPFDRLYNAHELVTLQRPVQSAAHLRVLLRILAPLVPRITISRAANLPFFSKVRFPREAYPRRSHLRTQHTAHTQLVGQARRAVAGGRASPCTRSCISNAVIWCSIPLVAADSVLQCRRWRSSLRPWGTCLGLRQTLPSRGAPTPSPTLSTSCKHEPVVDPTTTAHKPPLRLEPPLGLCRSRALLLCDIQRGSQRAPHR